MPHWVIIYKGKNKQWTGTQTAIPETVRVALKDSRAGRRTYVFRLKKFNRLMRIAKRRGLCKP